MKVKAIVTVVGLVVGVVLLRLVLSELAEPAAPLVTLDNTTESIGQPSTPDLPSGTWGKKPPEGDEKLDAGYKPRPEKMAVETESTQSSLAEVVEKLKAAAPMTAEQVLPEIASLLDVDSPLEVGDRKELLAEYIESVGPSVGEIQQSIAVLEEQDMQPERKQAYLQLAEQKIAALQELKQKAIALDASLVVEEKIK